MTLSVLIRRIASAMSWLMEAMESIMKMVEEEEE